MMRRTKWMCGLLMLIAVSASLGAATGPDAIAVSGAVAAPGDWAISRIRSELASDLTSISYTAHGQKHASDAVPLLSLLRASGVQTQLKMDPKAAPKKKNSELRLIVVVEARDGYVASFSLAEMLADVGGRHVWLALDMDGQPLPSRDGPMRLIVPEDKTPARWVHAVRRITVFDGAAATTQPAN
jgi:hypothetical protein